jgi:hypothetical protein
MTQPLAPAIPPVSSGSQRGGRLLGYSGIVLVVVVIARRWILVTWPLAPTIHPASSGSQQWGGCFPRCIGLWSLAGCGGSGRLVVMWRVYGVGVRTLQVPCCTGLPAPP